MFRSAPNAKTQSEAVREAIKRGANTDQHEGICWEVAGVTKYRKWHELTPAQMEMVNKREKRS